MDYEKPKGCRFNEDCSTNQLLSCCWKFKVVWNIRPYRLLNSCRLFERLQCVCFQAQLV